MRRNLEAQLDEERKRREGAEAQLNAVRQATALVCPADQPSLAQSHLPVNHTPLPLTYSSHSQSVAIRSLLLFTLASHSHPLTIHAHYSAKQFSHSRTQAIHPPLSVLIHERFIYTLTLRSAPKLLAPAARPSHLPLSSTLKPWDYRTSPSIPHTCCTTTHLPFSSHVTYTIPLSPRAAVPFCAPCPALESRSASKSRFDYPVATE